MKKLTLLASMLLCCVLAAPAFAQAIQSQDTAEATLSFEMTATELRDFLVYQVRLKAAPSAVDSGTLGTSLDPFAMTPFLTKVNLPSLGLADHWTEGYITTDGRFILDIQLGIVEYGRLLLAIYVWDCRDNVYTWWSYYDEHIASQSGARPQSAGEPHYMDADPSVCRRAESMLEKKSN